MLDGDAAPEKTKTGGVGREVPGNLAEKGPRGKARGR